MRLRFIWTQDRWSLIGPPNPLYPTCVVTYGSVRPTRTGHVWKCCHSIGLSGQEPERTQVMTALCAAIARSYPHDLIFEPDED
jgi:hypothetical protein